VVFKWVSYRTRSRGRANDTKVPETMLRTTLVNRIATMSRRSSRKLESNILEAHTTNVITSPSTTPKKGRKVVKVEEDAVIVTAKSPKVPKVKTETEAEAHISMTKVTKITSVKEEMEPKVKQESKPKKASAKRKAKTEEDDNGEEKEAVTKKKRKTKEEKEAENMPLATRTSIVTLEMSMHIGAHVSGAKGTWIIANIRLSSAH
jgi:AP endonuclease-1